MAEITRERSGQIVRAVFEVLREHPEGMQVRQVISEVERRLPPTQFEQAEYPSSPGSRRFDKIVRFATIPAVKAGWLVKSKGTWVLTDEGSQAYERITDPADFMREAVRLYSVWRKAQPDDEDVVEIEDVGEEISSATLEEAEEASWAEIGAYLANMPPYEFQELVASLLRAMGYHTPWVAPRGRDGGVDIIAYTDPLGASGPRIKVQVKRLNSGKVGVDGLRSFMAVLGTQDVGLFVAVSGFTNDAEQEARAQENRRLTLIDLEGLFNLWVEHYDSLSEEDKQRLPLRPVYFLAPTE